MVKLKYEGQLRYPIAIGPVVDPHDKTHPLDFKTMYMSWKSTTPDEIGEKSIYDLFSTEGMSAVMNIGITLKGTQNASDGKAVFRTTLTMPNKTIVYRYQKGPGKITYELDDTVPKVFTSLVTLPLNVKTAAYNVETNSTNYPAYIQDYALVFHVTVELDCSYSTLRTPICMAVCKESPGECLSSFREFCFPQNAEYTPECTEFIGNYISRRGVDKDTEADITRFCARRFKGFNELFQPDVSPHIQELCACHMPKEQYENYARQLRNRVPTVRLADRCLIPGCGASSVKSSDTSSPCLYPDCVSSVKFNPDGGYVESSMVIRNTPVCEAWKRGVDPIPDPDNGDIDPSPVTPTPIGPGRDDKKDDNKDNKKDDKDKKDDKKTPEPPAVPIWLWIVLAVIGVILLIVAGYFIYTLAKPKPIDSTPVSVNVPIADSSVI
mgnify:FL=1